MQSDMLFFDFAFLLLCFLSFFS